MQGSRSQVGTCRWHRDTRLCGRWDSERPGRWLMCQAVLPAACWLTWGCQLQTYNRIFSYCGTYKKSTISHFHEKRCLYLLSSSQVHGVGLIPVRADDVLLRLLWAHAHWLPFMNTRMWKCAPTTLFEAKTRAVYLMRGERENFKIRKTVLLCWAWGSSQNGFILVLNFRTTRILHISTPAYIYRKRTVQWASCPYLWGADSWTLNNTQ